MGSNKVGTRRKGLPEFLILGIESSRKSYATDMIQRPGTTDFATREGAPFPLLGRTRCGQLLDDEWQESGCGAPRKLAATGRKQFTEFRDDCKSPTRLIDELGKPLCKQ